MFLLPYIKSIAAAIWSFLMTIIKIPIVVIAALILIVGFMYWAKERAQAKLVDARAEIERQSSAITELESANHAFAQLIQSNNEALAEMEARATQKLREAEDIVAAHDRQRRDLQTRLDAIKNAPKEETVCATLQSDLRRWYSQRAAQQGQ